MNCIIFASLGCLIGAIAVTQASPISQQRDIHHRNVRDLFVTTGWGGAGLPYSTFYITGKQMKEIRGETSNDNTKRNANPNPEIISLIECVECAEKVATISSSKKTDRRTVPQLFSSSGWGPLGRRR